MQQVETLKYLGVVFTSDGSLNKGIDTRIGKANAVCVRQILQAKCWHLKTSEEKQL